MDRSCRSQIVGANHVVAASPISLAREKGNVGSEGNAWHLSREMSFFIIAVVGWSGLAHVQASLIPIAFRAEKRAENPGDLEKISGNFLCGTFRGNATVMVLKETRFNAEAEVH